MKRKSRKNTRNNNRSMLPVVLIGLGVLMVLGVLIWQLVSANTNNTPATTTQGRVVPVEDIDRVNLADSKAAFDEGSAVFVDVRDAGTYSAGHIPGAVNIPLALIEGRADELDPNQWIITYCT